jgi:hypothetical protein
MGAPIWSAATPGQATLAGQINQFLAVHTASLLYDGSLVITAPTISGSPATDTFTTTQTQFAFRFATSTSAVALTRVAFAIGATGAGVDLLVTLQGDNGSGPNGTVITSSYLPAEWLSSGTQTAVAPAHGIPLQANLNPLTYYNIVITPASTFNSTNNVVVSHSTATSGAQTYNGSTWTPQSYGYGVNLYTGTSGYLRLTNEDAGVMMKGYDFTSGAMSAAREWVKKASSAPNNLVTRDDAGFTTGIGSWAATNCTIAQSTTLALDGSTSGKITAATTPSTMTVACGANLIPVTVGTAYSACASIAPATTLRRIQVSINWYNGSTLISNTPGATITQTAVNTYTQATVVLATAPAGATYASVLVTITPASGTIATGEIHYVDCAGLFNGANTTWSYPGTGIASTKTVTFTNGLLTSVQ